MTHRLTSQPRPRPPYARHISAARASRTPNFYWGTSPNGKAFTIWLLIGDRAWSTAKEWVEHRRLCTLLPPDNEDPANINWTPLSGTDPIIICRCGRCLYTGHYFHRLLAAMMRDGVQRILDPDQGMSYANIHKVSS
jgi:hypothetical protein